MWPFNGGRLFPYTNTHELNLDWILSTLGVIQSKIDSIPDTFVASVNGETGVVTLYPNAQVRFPDVSEDENWNVYRLVNGTARGIEFATNGKTYLIQGTTRKRVLTEEDIPSESGVVSVNGQAGIVVLDADDIDLGDNSLAEIIGTVPLPTTAQTLTGAIDELNTDQENLSDAIDDLEESLSTVSENLETISEAVTDLDNGKVDKTSLPLSAELVNTNANIYQMKDANGNPAYTKLLTRYYNKPDFIEEGNNCTLTNWDFYLIGNVAIVSFVISVIANQSGAFFPMYLNKYRPATDNYGRGDITAENGDCRQLILNPNGNFTMYGCVGGQTYRGSIIYCVDVIPAES